MFGHKKSKRQQQHNHHPSQPTNQFALAAARAIVPPRSQTPTLSAAAAAAALHASPKQVTSPASLVTRRMERRGSISSITSAPPGFASPITGSMGIGRRGSDASMTERIGWLRGGNTTDEHGTSSSSRPGSRQRPISREVVASPTKGVGKRVSIEDHRTSTRTLGQLESKHTPKPPGKVAPKSAIKGGNKAKATREVAAVEEEPVREVKKASKPRKANTKPKPAPEPVHAAAVVAALAVASTSTPKKSQPKAKPKPKPKPVEPVYLSESDEEEEQQPPARTYPDSESDDEEEEPEELPLPRRPQSSSNLKKSLRKKASVTADDGSVHLKKSLRATPSAEAVAKTPTKKKSIQTHSDIQGGMLSRGTMRAVVREDMEPIIDEARERRQLASKAAKASALQESAHAAKRHEEPRAAAGPSDAVKALALQIMREQQAKAAGKPVLLESSRAKKRAAAAAVRDSDSDSDLEPEPEQEPDTHIDEDEAFAAEQEEESRQKEEEDRQVYKRHQYNGSVSSVTSFMSDLESIPEEAGDQGLKADGKKKKKKKKAPESVIIPGRDGVPALPSSPILEKERMRLAQVASPEPPKTHSVERKRTLEKLTGGKAAKDTPVEDSKGSPPSSATLTEEVSQPVLIQTIPPTPPYTMDKLHPPPRLFEAGSSDDEVKPAAEANGAALKPKAKASPPPRETHSPRPMKRHSPPPRSVSPAKSAMKHTQHHEGSDRSSILSAEDGSVGGHGRRKAARVSFSEDPSVVEMDDDSYHYKPIHSALDKVTEKKGAAKSIGAVSFSSVSRTRVERTPSPEPSSLAAAQPAVPIEHSADHRLGGLIGAGLLGKLTKGKGKKEAEKHSAQKRGSHDPLAPEVSSMSPAPSISDDDLESDNDETPATVEFAKAMPIVAAVATPPLAMSTPPPTAGPSVPPALVIAKPPTPEEPKEEEILVASPSHHVVEVKPIFPPPASDTATTLSENIAHGRPVVFKDDSGEDEDHFSDAYEDLDHVVLSATGSGAVIGVTAAHVHGPGTAITTEGQVAVTDTVVLPSISEVADRPVEVTTPPRSLPPQIVGGLLPEEIITDEKQHAHTILSPKPIKPVSPKVISAGLISSPSPPIVHTPPVPTVVKAKATNGVSKPAGTKATKAKAKAAKPKNDLSESEHAPKPKKVKAVKAAAAPAPVPVPVPAPVPTANRRLSKSKPTHAPAPVAAPQRRLSVSSDDSESSFQRENPHRKAARRSQGFSMRTSMRDSTGHVPPSSATSPYESGLATNRFSEPSASSRFESGFRTGRTIGTGGPRRREYSPDSSDDDRVKSLRAPAKVEKKSRFLGNSTLRNGNASGPAGGRPHSSLGFAPKASTNSGRSGFKGFRSRFEDSSDEEDAQIAAVPRTRPATTYRPLTPDSSDDELPVVQTNGNKPQQNGLHDSAWAPATANGENYAFATEISAEIEPKKKWWSFGSKRKSGTASRPVSRANSMMSAAPAPLVTNLPPALDRRISDPDHFSSPMSTTAAHQRNQQLKKYRRLSNGSVNSIGSAKTWTPSLGTSTLVGSPSGVSSGNRNLTHGRLAELQEEDEEEHVLNSDPIDNGAVANGKAQIVEPNGGVYGTPKAPKKKKFRGLRKIFGIDD
ncbi:hypothetical protein TWF481_006912 [Arthrobotrys musiformis]|uniref:Uncharacterized protein n=1 Tax=Arthrobotrys musiformis TaxID=47236 RepID=A0AAV9W9W6_9PEZI